MPAHSAYFEGAWGPLTGNQNRWGGESLNFAQESVKQVLESWDRYQVSRVQLEQSLGASSATGPDVDLAAKAATLLQTRRIVDNASAMYLTFRATLDSCIRNLKQSIAVTKRHIHGAGEDATFHLPMSVGVSA